ncbi:MAG: SPOR domain-containing protein [Ahrensia sp.]|nr:SPOR domain-containing protein [Ahrensia sp.]
MSDTVHEFNDSFLMGGVASDEPPRLIVHCSIERDNTDDLHELARLVGERNKLEEQANRDDVPSWTRVTQDSEAPRLEFDLEDELKRALEGSQSATQDADTNSPSRSTPADDYSDPFASSPELEDSALNSLVSEELEKALQDFDADGLADMRPTEASTIDIPTTAAPDMQEGPSEDSLETFSKELAQLMGEPDPVDDPIGATSSAQSSAAAQSVSDAAASSEAPMPTEAVMPWEAPEIIQSSMDRAETDAVGGVREVEFALDSEFAKHEAGLARSLDLPHDDASAADGSADRLRDRLPHIAVAGAVAGASAMQKSGGRQTDIGAAGTQNALEADLEAALSRELDAELTVVADEAGAIDASTDGEFSTSDDEEKTGFPKRYAIAAAALLVIGVGGYFAWSGFSSQTGEPVTILASQEPVKVEPEDSGGRVVPNQDQSVYEAVDGEDETPPQQTALNESTEEPIAVTTTPSVDEQAATDAQAGSDSTERSAARQGGPGPIVAPRRVRTVVVRPDGTIIARAPTDQPADPQQNNQTELALATSNNAPEPIAVPTTSIPATDAPAASIPQQTQGQPADAATDTDNRVNGGSDQTSTTDATATAEAESQTNAAEQTAAVSAEGQDTQAQAPQTAAPLPNVTIPKRRPANAPVRVSRVQPSESPSQRTTRQAAAARTSGASDPLAPSAAASPFRVQVSSRRSAEAAQQAYNSLVARYGGIIGGRGVDIQRSTVNGVNFFRVRIPASSRQEAQTMCNRLKAQGGDCFVTR